MLDYAKVEGDEIVVRIKVNHLPIALEHAGLKVTEPKSFAPHLAREMNAEGMDGDLFINKFFDAAAVRAYECAAPGVEEIEYPL